MAKWKVKSGGLTYGRKRYGKGDIISLPPGTGERYVNKLELIEPDPPDDIICDLIAVSRGMGDFDVLNMRTGEKINKEPLTKQEAEDLVNQGAAGKEPEKDDGKPVLEIPKDVERTDGPPPRRRSKPKKG